MLESLKYFSLTSISACTVPLTYSEFLLPEGSAPVKETLTDGEVLSMMKLPPRSSDEAVFPALSAAVKAAR